MADNYQQHIVSITFADENSIPERFLNGKTTEFERTVNNTFRAVAETDENLMLLFEDAFPDDKLCHDWNAAFEAEDFDTTWELEEELNSIETWIERLPDGAEIKIGWFSSCSKKRVDEYSLGIVAAKKVNGKAEIHSYMV